MPSLSCFFPCYNDAESIGRLVTEVDAVAAAWTDDYEIIVVDDGSTDGSHEVLKCLQETIPALKLVLHEANRGYGGALRSGFETATKDWVFYTDGDGQYDVEELRVLLDALRPDVDVVNGYKIARSDAWYRKLVGILYREGMRLLFRFQVRDVNCDFRLIRRSVMGSVRLTHTSGVVCVELVKKLERAGARFVNVPVHHFPRLHGGSQFFRFRRLVETFLDVGRLWWSLR